MQVDECHELTQSDYEKFARNIYAGEKAVLVALACNLVGDQKDNGENNNKKLIELYIPQVVAKKQLEETSEKVLTTLKEKKVTTDKNNTTTLHSSHRKTGWAIFVIQQGNLYIDSYNPPQVQHSSLSAGKEVEGVGEIKFEQNPETKKIKILGLTDYSGHYAPTHSDIYRTLLLLKIKDYDISECVVYVDHSPTRKIFEEIQENVPILINVLNRLDQSLVLKTKHSANSFIRAMSLTGCVKQPRSIFEDRQLQKLVLNIANEIKLNNNNKLEIETQHFYTLYTYLALNHYPTKGLTLSDLFDLFVVVFYRANKQYDANTFPFEFNYESYSLALMLEGTNPEEGKFYVRMANNDLEYCVIDPKGKSVTGKIEEKKLAEILEKEEIDQLRVFELEKLKPFLSKILRITSEKGHTHSEKQSISIDRCPKVTPDAYTYFRAQQAQIATIHPLVAKFEWQEFKREVDDTLKKESICGRRDLEKFKQDLKAFCREVEKDVKELPKKPSIQAGNVVKLIVSSREMLGAVNNNNNDNKELKVKNATFASNCENYQGRQETKLSGLKLVKSIALQFIRPLLMKLGFMNNNPVKLQDQNNLFQTFAPTSQA